MIRLTNCLAAGLLLLGLTGCSISYSFEKSSDSISESLDSISASFTSFSDSSGSGEEEVTAHLQRFYRDVKALARVWSRDGRDGESFESELDLLAHRYGIVNWDTHPQTFMAIGSGLRQAGVEAETLPDQLFLKTELMHHHEQEILRGYRTG